MRSSLGLSALAAAAFASTATTAEPITVGEHTNLVIDVEFWGRQQLRAPHPNDPTDDIITYGDPVRGTFRIFADDAPAPGMTSAFLDNPNAVAYGRFAVPRGDHPAASFVTSRWLSPLPAGFVNDVAPFPGGTADDFMQIGDGVLFRPEGPVQDWFQVADTFSDNPSFADGDALFITVTTPRDIIRGVGLNQEFDLVDPSEHGGSGYGFFTDVAEGVGTFFEFIVDRVRVSPRVCKP